MNTVDQPKEQTVEQAAVQQDAAKPMAGDTGTPAIDAVIKGAGGKTKTPEFTAEAITTALAEMGYNVENNLITLGYKVQFLETTEAALVRCRNLVVRVQGEEAGKSAEPVALERYRKRVERMFTVLENAAKPAVTSTTLNSRMAVTKKGPKSPVAKAAKTSENGGTVSNPTDPVVATADSKTQKGAKGRTAMATKKKAASKKNGAAPKAAKGPGVIDTIVTLLQGGGGTIEDIAAKLAKKFPDRKLDGLTATTKIQMSRLQTPKNAGGRGLKIKRDKTEGSNALVYRIG